MQTSRRQIIATAATGGALLALGGCEKVVSLMTAELGQTVPDAVAPPTGIGIDPIHHLLNRAGFGPWPGDVERVRAMGAEKWIDEQLAFDSIPDRACDLRARRAEFEGHAGECYEYEKPVLREEMARKSLLRALYSKRQLFESMVAFWTDHLNINIEKGDCIYLKPWDDQNVVRAHALGKFRDLIRASATSPAMLVYLDGNQNVGTPDHRYSNENYGRELLELHTLGVHGVGPQADVSQAAGASTSSANSKPDYSQADVAQAACALTGWRVRTGFMKGSVHFISSEHDQQSKTVLGKVIPAGRNEKDVDDLVDIVCRHPSTANHIATKLVRRFVSEDPPLSLVQKIAAVFQSTDGDIKSMMRTLLTSDEFKASAGAKFKPPLRFVVSALRAVGADTHAHSPLIQYLTQMGQGVFEYPTPDGYPDKTSPWLGTLLWRWNFAFSLAANQIPATQVPFDKLTHALGATGDAAATRLYEHCAGHQPTDEQQSALAEAMDGKANNTDATKQVLGLVLSSPGFQRY